MSEHGIKLGKFKGTLKAWLLMLLALATCLLAGCDSGAKLPPLTRSATILAFGDSLTQGVGAKTEQSYPTVLAEITGLSVVNAGISGEVTAEGLARLPHELDNADPDLLILIEGGNDILRNHNLSETKRNLSEMISLAKNKNIPVVLLAIPEKKLFSDAAPFYRELAEEHQLVFDGSLIADLLRELEYKADPIHFNAKGYRKMAEGIHELLKQHGAL